MKNLLVLLESNWARKQYDSTLHIKSLLPRTASLQTKCSCWFLIERERMMRFHSGSMWQTVHRAGQVNTTAAHSILHLLTTISSGTSHLRAGLDEVNRVTDPAGAGQKST